MATKKKTTSKKAPPKKNAVKKSSVNKGTGTNYQVKSFRVIQTSLMWGALYFFLSLIIVVPLFLVEMIHPSELAILPGWGPVFMILVPIVYAIMGFVFNVIMTLFYNLASKFIGGIGFTLEETK